MRQSVIKAGLGYTIANVMIRGLSFLTLPIFTRMLTKSDFGYYSTYLTYESIFVVILGLAFHSSLRSAKIEFGDQNIDKYVSSIALFPLLCTLVLSALLWPFRNEIGFLTGIGSFYFMLMLVQAWAGSVSSLYNSRVALDFEYSKYLIVSVFSAGLNIGLSLLLMETVFCSNKLLGRVMGMLIATVIVAIGIFIFLLKKDKIVFNVEYLKFALKYSLPIIPHGLSQIVLSQFAKIVIMKKIGSDAAGLYGFVFTIVLIPQTIIASFDTTYSTWFYNTYLNEETNKVREKAKQYVLFFSILLFLFASIVPEIIKVMAEKSYWEAIDLIYPAVFSCLFIFFYNIQ